MTRPDMQNQLYNKAKVPILDKVKPTTQAWKKKLTVNMDTCYLVKFGEVEYALKQ